MEKNISLFGKIMKLGTHVGYPHRIIFRLGPNSEMPPGGRHLGFQNGRRIGHTFDNNFETKSNRKVILRDNPTFLGSRNVFKPKF